MTQTPKIIYEDESLMVLDKPAGWIVNDAQTAKGQNIIQTWLSDEFNYPISKDFSLRSGVVHRIDKETSGILVIAKTEDAFRALQKQFKDRVVEKTYIALAHGEVAPKEGLIDAPVGRLPWNRRRFGIVAGGRDAQTRYEAISLFQKGDQKFTLLHLFPKTGRTHQIRVHLKHIGHPVVSDEMYAGRKTSRADRKFCPRLFLHAASISFIHPESGKRVEFQSELSQELDAALASLEKIS